LITPGIYGKFALRSNHLPAPARLTHFLTFAVEAWCEPRVLNRG
jgi:hypothetical protein